MTISISPVMDSWLDASESLEIDLSSPAHEVGQLLRQEIPNLATWIMDPFVKEAIDRYGRTVARSDLATPNLDQVVVLVWLEAESVRHASEIDASDDLMVECWGIELESLTADDFDF